MDYKKTETGWRYKTQSEAPGLLTVIDKSGDRQPIKRLQPSEAYKILGIKISPDDNSKSEVEFLRGKGEAFAARVQKWRNKVKNDIWLSALSVAGPVQVRSPDQAPR